MTTLNDENHETFSVIWLDNDVSVFEKNIVVQQQIRSFINRLKTFDDVEQCERFIQLMSEDDRVVLIVCAGLSQKIIPRIDNFRQVASIYVYFVDNEEKREWMTKSSKVYVKLISVNRCSLTKFGRIDYLGSIF